MKPGDLEYQALVEKKRAEIRGNVSSVKMTPEETEKEIAEVTEGVFEREEGNKGEIKIQRMPIITPTSSELDVMAKTLEQTQGYVTKSGRHYKAKPGRRPKVK